MGPWVFTTKTRLILILSTPKERKANVKDNRGFYLSKFMVVLEKDLFYFFASLNLNFQLPTKIFAATQILMKRIKTKSFFCVKKYLDIHKVDKNFNK